MEKIMVIEDNQELSRELKILLENQGYSTVLWDGAGECHSVIRSERPDLLLLDINLPGKNGYTLCREIRKYSQLPVIFLTARDTSMDELEALQIGGDDFITKPYKAPVLLARIQNVLRRYGKAEKVSVMEYGGVVLDLGASRISYQGKSAELGKNEQKILCKLFEQKGNIVSRETLGDYLWDNQIYIDDNTLSVNVRRLREKLASIGLSDFIKTKRGMGYQI